MCIILLNPVLLWLFLLTATRAQLSQFPPALVANLSASLNTTWNKDVQLACMNAMATAGGLVNNPSGMLACYNVAVLEGSNGLFTGDVRLYSVAQSTLPTNSSIRLRVDFGKAGIVQSITQSQSPGPSQVSVMKRNPSPDPQPQNRNNFANASKGKNPAQSGSVVPSKAPGGSTNPPNSVTPVSKAPPTAASPKTQFSTNPEAALNPQSTVRPGSQAGVAKPQSDLVPISAGAFNPPTAENTVLAAILPEEQLQNPQQIQGSADRMLVTKQNITSMTVFEAAGVLIGSTSELLSDPLPQSTQNQEVKRLQFTGQLDVDLANSNPNNLGLAGSLLPRISLLVTAPDQSQHSIDMSKSTSAYLQGVRGSLIPIGTFVLPGRVFLGSDGSVDRTGLYISGIYFIVFVAMMVGGIWTRLSIRHEYRAQLRRN